MVVALLDHVCAIQGGLMGLLEIVLLARNAHQIVVGGVYAWPKTAPATLVGLALTALCLFATRQSRCIAIALVTEFARTATAHAIEAGRTTIVVAPYVKTRAVRMDCVEMEPVTAIPGTLGRIVQRVHTTVNVQVRVVVMGHALSSFKMHY